MGDIGDRQLKIKLATDSGYGSKRSSGSSKSQGSGLSIDDGSAKEVSGASLHNISEPTTTGCTKNQNEDQESSSPVTPTGLPTRKRIQSEAWNRALCRIQTLKTLPFPDIFDETDADVNHRSSTWHAYFPDHDESEFTVTDGGGDSFATILSMDDGTILYVHPNITNVLGFSKNMMQSRTFIDFVHPKDRMAFATHTTYAVKFPDSGKSSSAPSETFFCRIRQHMNLDNVGNNNDAKKPPAAVHFPFKLSMNIKEASLHGEESTQSTGKGNGGNMRHDVEILPKHQYQLVIWATKISSSYQYPEEEMTTSSNFVTRHSATCHFGYVDTEAIPFLGHMPQDMIGNSVLDYYHPEDLICLKDIYEGVLQEQGKPFRSKPYRFRVFNGTFVMLETDWSCFVNPWSWKLEFVIGQHRVIKGPVNPNVFMPPPREDEDQMEISDADAAKLKEKQLKEEIKKMLTTTIIRPRNAQPKIQKTSQRKDLTSLIEKLLKELGKESIDPCDGSVSCDLSPVLERDSVMLGVSPYCGSNESSEAPPSYNQLNYRENIHRFFQSHPKTSRSTGSRENQLETNRSSDDDSKESPNGGGGYTSGSNNRKSSGSNGSEDPENCDTGSLPLTEELIIRHNEDMQKLLLQRHKEQRGKTSTSASSTQKYLTQKQKAMERPTAIAAKRPTDWNSDAPFTGKRSKMELNGERVKHCVESWPCFSCNGSNSIFGMASAPCPGYPHFTNPVTGQLRLNLPPGNLLESQRSPFICMAGQQRRTLLPPQVPYGYMQPGLLCHPSRGHPHVMLPRYLAQERDRKFGQENATSLGAQLLQLNTRTPTTAMRSSAVSTTGVMTSTSNSKPHQTATKGSLKVSSRTDRLSELRDSGKETTKTKSSTLRDGSPSFSSSDYFGDSNSSFNYSNTDSCVFQQKSNDHENIHAVQELKPLRQKEPSWMDDVPWTPDLILRYRIPDEDLNNILKKDLLTLTSGDAQSGIVNDQLNQLYRDMESEGCKKSSLLDESASSSMSETAESSDNRTQNRRSEHLMDSYRFGWMAFLHEENAPFPPMKSVASV